MSINKPVALLQIPSRALGFVRQCGASRASLTSMLLLLLGKASIDALSALLLAGVLALMLPVGRPMGGWYAQVEAFSYGPLHGVLSPMLLLVAILVLCKGILTPLLLWLRGWLIDQWTLLVSMSVLERELAPGVRQRQETHAQSSNVAVNFVVPRIVMGAILPSLDLLTEALLIGVLLSVLVALEPVATSMMVVALLVALCIGNGVSRLLMGARGDLKFRHQTLMQRWVTDSVACLREIRLYQRVPAVLARYRPVARHFSRESARERTFMDIQSPVMELFFLLVLGSAVLVASEGSGQADFHLLALFSAVGLRLILGFRRITSILQTLRFVRPALAQLTAVAPRAANEALIAPCEDESEKQLLLCESLRYRYPGAGQDVICGLNLCLRKGEWTGLVGESGVGKSTLVDLLIGALQPLQGRIQWFCSGRAHAGIGYAGASTTLIPGTLRDNVSFLGEHCTDQQLAEALRIADIGSLLDRLPEGLDTPVEVFEQRISSGERQRIGLARALLHAQSLLILDEATASLDQLTESRFLEGLRTARPGLAVLLITHRLTVLRYTDRSLLMVNGALDEFIPDPHMIQATGQLGHKDKCI